MESSLADQAHPVLAHVIVGHELLHMALLPQLLVMLVAQMVLLVTFLALLSPLLEVLLPLPEVEPQILIVSGIQQPHSEVLYCAGALCEPHHSHHSLLPSSVVVESQLVGLSLVMEFLRLGLALWSLERAG